MIHEHDRIVLTTDLPAEGLRAGDIGTVVHVYADRGAFEIEFVALDGETVGVATLTEANLRPIARHEIAHARRLTA